MFLLFVIGILLIMVTFSAYSKLGSGCRSKDLRTKLRWAIGIGTTFVTISMGYTICVSREGCSCDFGERANWKIYIMLYIINGYGNIVISFIFRYQK